MTKGFRKYLILILVLLFTGCSDSGNRNVNWSKTFDSEQSIPYGTMVLRKELNKIFPESEITDIKENTFDFFLNDDIATDENLYMFIYDFPFFEDYTWNKILNFVNQGGNAFLSISGIDEELVKELGIDVAQIEGSSQWESVKLTVNTDKKTNEYVFDGKGKSNMYFKKFDENYTDVLGYLNTKEKTEPNFIKYYYGRGSLLLHLEPIAFTNYEMLKKNHYQYAVDVLSYAEGRNILWDNKRILSRHYDNSNKNSNFFNSLSFIMKNKQLRTAFYILLCLAAAFVFFNSKRRQRAQEVVLPYPNYTLDFSKTLAELYRYNADHTALVKYKINYFLEQLRINYHITAKDTEKDFADVLSSKSGVDFDDCDKLVTWLNMYRNKNYHDKEDFIKIQSLIESFNRKSNIHGRESGK